jgi:hypothetical protein
MGWQRARCFIGPAGQRRVDRGARPGIHRARLLVHPRLCSAIRRLHRQPTRTSVPRNERRHKAPIHHYRHDPDSGDTASVRNKDARVCRGRAVHALDAAALGGAARYAIRAWRTRARVLVPLHTGARRRAGSSTPYRGRCRHGALPSDAHPMRRSCVRRTCRAVARRRSGPRVRCVLSRHRTKCARCKKYPRARDSILEVWPARGRHW